MNYHYEGADFSKLVVTVDNHVLTDQGSEKTIPIIQGESIKSHRSAFNMKFPMFEMSQRKQKQCELWMPTSARS